MDSKEIRGLFGKFGAEIGHDDIWKVQAATVIKHKALEKLAAAAKIKFDAPIMLRSERDEAVILVTGHLQDRSEWSIGEARIVRMIDTGRKNSYGKPIYEPGDGEMGNYQITPKQAAYVYAMAEKRAKDRVILKLAGLHGIYSEDEADDFRQGMQAQSVEPDASRANPGDVERILAMIERASSAVELGRWMAAPKVANALDVLSAEDRAVISEAQAQRLAELEKEAA